MRTLILFMALSAGSLLRAQDFHLSMYDAAPLYLNPAMTGIFEGKWRLHGQFRTQWKAVNYKPYTSGLVSFDMPYKKWGFGVQVSNYRAGAGNFNEFEAVLSAAYTTPITRNRFHNFSFGVQAGGQQKSIEHQLLSFNNQYTTEGGGTFEQSISSGESIGAQSRLLPSTNAGVMYYYSRTESRLNPFIGFSAFNLLRTDESLISSGSRQPIRYYVHAGTRVNLSETFYLIPKVLVMHQLRFDEQTFGLDAGYYVRNADFYLLGGFVYRNRDAAVLSIGAKMDGWIARIAYDINVSSLSVSSAGRGGFELSFTYMKSNPKGPVSKICPRL